MKSEAEYGSLFSSDAAEACTKFIKEYVRQMKELDSNLEDMNRILNKFKEWK